MDMRVCLNSTFDIAQFNPVSEPFDLLINSTNIIQQTRFVSPLTQIPGTVKADRSAEFFAQRAGIDMDETLLGFLEHVQVPC